MAVAGVKDRESGTVTAEVVPDTKAATLHAFTAEHIEKGGTLYSDDNRAYEDFEHVAKHQVVRHSIGEYVRGMAHNGMESFWAMMKRGFHGTYHRMSPKHLQRYVNDVRRADNVREKATVDQLTGAVPTGRLSAPFWAAIRPRPWPVGRAIPFSGWEA